MAFLKDTNPIVLALPFFALGIGIELFVAWKKGRKLYRLNDSFSNLMCGSLDQTFGIFTSGILLAGYARVYQNHALFSWPAEMGMLQWFVLFLLVDFLYWLFHMSSHKINILWATHIPHHNSEEYNLSVALRQGPLQKFGSWIFNLPLALIGFPPGPMFLMRSMNTLYQFWIHSRLIPKLGPMEWVFNTASHHRIHHARDLHYLDKNFGGILIIWDRLFGTFAEEKEEPTYGITRKVESFNPIWSVFHWWKHIFISLFRIKRWRDKLIYPFMPPGFVPEGLTPYKADPAYTFHDPQIPPSMKRGSVVFFILFMTGAVALLIGADNYNMNLKLFSFLLVLILSVLVGKMLEGKIR